MQAHHANTQLVGWWSGTRGVGGKSLLCIICAVPTVPCLGTATVPCLGTSTVPCLGTFAVPAWDACQYPAWVRLPVPCLGTLASPCLGRLLVPCLGTLTDSLPGNVLPVFFFFFFFFFFFLRTFSSLICHGPTVPCMYIVAKNVMPEARLKQEQLNLTVQQEGHA